MEEKQFTLRERDQYGWFMWALGTLFGSMAMALFVALSFVN